MTPDFSNCWRNNWMLFWQLRSLDDKLEERNNSIFANGVILTNITISPFLWSWSFNWYSVEFSVKTSWSCRNCRICILTKEYWIRLELCRSLDAHKWVLNVLNALEGLEGWINSCDRINDGLWFLVNDWIWRILNNLFK